MALVREKLVGGPGIAVVDRFPVEEYTADEAKAVGWLLAGILGRIVAQKWDGTRLYDVKDSGQALGLRRPALGDQSRTAVSHGRPVALEAAGLRRALLSGDGARGR